MTLRPSRRDLLRIAAAMPALTLTATASRAAITAPGRPNPGYMRFTFGEAAVTVVSDGHLEIPADGLGINADPEEVRAFLTRHFLSTETNYAHANHVVIETGDAVVLVDIGSGNRFLPTAGRLLDNLAAAGIDAEAITHLVITHAHPDHIWGIRDDFDEALLPGAQKFLGQAEHDFWMQDALVNQVATEMQQFVVGAQNSITADGAEWSLVGGETEVALGVRVIDTPGHTPGHQSLVLASGGSEMLITGDALNHAYLNFAHPGWVNNFDMDGDQTAATRSRLLDMAATDGMAVLGYHFPYPGVGHVMRDGDAYRFVPALWRWE